MNDTKALVGALSNDLFRVATLSHRGSKIASSRFAQESKRWAIPLLKKDIPLYIKNIAKDVANIPTEINKKEAEKLLMYGILLQNYSLHMK